MILPPEDRCDDCPYDERNTYVQRHCPICHQDFNTLAEHFLRHEDEDLDDTWVRLRSKIHGAQVVVLSEMTEDGVDTKPFLVLWTRTRDHDDPDQILNFYQLIDLRNSDLLQQIATISGELVGQLKERGI